jgi:ABC-type Na+ efflux pump permease subunit
MKYALLVAWRDYAENAKTKGFWLGLFLFPAILFLSIQIPVFLEQKAAPIRHFILVDQSGLLAPAVKSALETSERIRPEKHGADAPPGARRRPAPGRAAPCRRAVPRQLRALSPSALGAGRVARGR